MKMSKIKRSLVLVSLVLVSFCLSACTQIKTTGEPSVSKNENNISTDILSEDLSENAIEREPYVYEGESNINIDDRSFVLEDIPESLAEETVTKYYLYTITAEFDAMYDILSDKDDVFKITTENEKKLFAEGMYTQSYIIHKISTLSEEDYSEQLLDNGEENPLYHYGWEECNKKYGLTEYEIVYVNFTQTLSKKAIEHGAQWGNETYGRCFLVGRTSDDDSYKIYDIGTML